MASNATSDRSRRTTRRQFIAATAATAATAGGGTAAARQPVRRGGSPPGRATDRDVDVRCGVPEDADDPVLAALERNAVPLEFGDGTLHLCDLAVTATRLLEWPALGRLFRARSWQRSSDELPETVIAGALSEYPIVGMGEATHGTKEFDAIRRQLVQRLVEDHGLRVFAIEDQFSSLAAANDYVVHGEGSIQDAVEAVQIWFMRTAELRDLLEWFRAFNRGRPREDRVEVYGIDSQFAAAPARELLDFLDRAEQAGRTGVEDVLTTITESDGVAFVDYGEEPGDESLHEENVAAARDAIERLREHLEAHREELVASTSERAVLLADQHVRTLEQAAGFWETNYDDSQPGAEQELRDRFMAENVTWLREELDRGQVAFWAHNVHVGRGEVYEGLRSMGDVLAETHGDDYYPLALSFGRGAVTTYLTDEWRRGAVTIDSPNAATPERLVDVPYPSFFLDFDLAEDDQIFADWLEDDHALHFVGGDDFEAGRPDPVDLAADFDGLLFVRESTPTEIVELAPEQEAGDDRETADGEDGAETADESAAGALGGRSGAD